jgi:hypothetical protein
LHGYRLRDGNIVAWDPVPGRTVLSWSDFDRDGRPDLVLDSVPNVVAIAHSLPAGRFSTDDDVTRAVLRASCARPVVPYSSPLAVPVPFDPSDDQIKRLEEQRAPICAPVMDPPCAGDR